MASMSKVLTTKGVEIWRVQVAILGFRKTASFRTKREAVSWAAYTEGKVRDEARHKRELRKKIGGRESAFSAEEILSNRIPVHNVPGIYILFDGDRVTYIGQSKNVIKRLTSHADKGRVFSSYFVIPCIASELDKMEQHYIKLLDPPENKTLFSRPAYSLHASNSSI